MSVFDSLGWRPQAPHAFVHSSILSRYMPLVAYQSSKIYIAATIVVKRKGKLNYKDIGRLSNST